MLVFTIILYMLVAIVTVGLLSLTEIATAADFVIVTYVGEATYQQRRRQRPLASGTNIEAKPPH